MIMMMIMMMMMMIIIIIIIIIITIIIIIIIIIIIVVVVAVVPSGYFCPGLYSDIMNYGLTFLFSSGDSKVSMEEFQNLMDEMSKLDQRE